ncbi:S8 family serine peptidase [Shewanella sp. JBTF-M18]|uniref:S8 family serine peptidase n=1 Tax=Shewanella insulae TaxID=2681496 RepID=A0A6L7HWT0_9GAMM|nr:S8 family serine peptidase [Shewanella insulae]MXR67588.1 S8 family serine peptidase [Shewanella insulae]
MKISKLASMISLLALGIATSSQAADNRYVIQVDNQHKGIVKALAVKSGATIKLDGDGFFAATFDNQDLAQVKGLLNNPHVRLVEEDQRRTLQSLYQDDAGDPMQAQVTPYAVYQSQADQVDFVPGTATKVCVIDSGLDRSNPDFNWGAITGDNDSGTGDWDVNGGPHGTHVAGTIGAADNGIGVVGMAPGVEMHIIKVFTASGWAYSSDLAHATDLCSQAGANIISMSLGGGGANSVESNAFEAFTQAGGLVVAAAGNDGNNSRSYPAGYPSVMMIGANDADNNIASFSQFPSCSSGRGKRATMDENICVEVTAGGVQTLSTYPAGMSTMASMSADGVYYDSAAMENAGSASGSTYFMGTAEAIDSGANGKVCMIDRGNISFHDKVANCEASGGIGAIIINNVEGMLYGTLGDANTTHIPTVGAALADRTPLLSATMATVNISASDYGYMSGTSMATPAVSGVAALVWSNFPECTGSEIRQALKATAEDQGAPGHDEYFGYGIVKAKAAYDYLLSGGCDGQDSQPGTFSLTAEYEYAKGKHRVNLATVAAPTPMVDLYRNEQIIATVPADTFYTDSFGRKESGTFSYKACEENTQNCTQAQSISF